ncbi:hypothetical protein CRC_02637 [Cylindrospermopsis raciborskii CS-505]|nr:hypothetical protein CRC_02637 [Cylindrospermopsis raciborskii CS-505]
MGTGDREILPKGDRIALPTEIAFLDGRFMFSKRLTVTFSVKDESVISKGCEYLEGGFSKGTPLKILQNFSLRKTGALFLI